MKQLGLDGRETDHPPRAPRPLTDRQRELVLWLRLRGTVRPVEVGQIMHAGREPGPGLTLCAARDDGGACCRWASSDGWDALRRLERRGLVERVGRGQWRLRVVVEGDWAQAEPPDDGPDHPARVAGIA